VPKFFKKKICHKIQKFLTPKKREIEKIEHNFNFSRRKKKQGEVSLAKRKKRMDEEGNG
jgi:hypothetical protein